MDNIIASDDQVNGKQVIDDQSDQDNQTSDRDNQTSDQSSAKATEHKTGGINNKSTTIQLTNQDRLLVYNIFNSVEPVFLKATEDNKPTIRRSTYRPTPRSTSYRPTRYPAKYTAKYHTTHHLTTKHHNTHPYTKPRSIKPSKIAGGYFVLY